MNGSPLLNLWAATSVSSILDPTLQREAVDGRMRGCTEAAANSACCSAVCKPAAPGGHPCRCQEDLARPVRAGDVRAVRGRSNHRRPLGSQGIGRRAARLRRSALSMARTVRPTTLREAPRRAGKLRRLGKDEGVGRGARSRSRHRHAGKHRLVSHRSPRGRRAGADRARP